MTTLLIVIIIIAAILFVFNIALVLKGRCMRKREALLIENGIVPYGSALCHGMTIDRAQKNKVNDCRKKSQTWYARLT